LYIHPRPGFLGVIIGLLAAELGKG